MCMDEWILPAQKAAYLSEKIGPFEGDAIQMSRLMYPVAMLMACQVLYFW